MHIRTTIGILIIFFFSLGIVFAMLAFSIEMPVFRKTAPENLVLPSINLQRSSAPTGSGFVAATVEDLPTSLSENGVLYENKAMGFSIVIPKTMILYGGGCASGHLYNDHVPVKAFEGKHNVVIQAIYQYADDQKCTKQESVADPYSMGWAFEMRSVASQADLLAWIKERYGKGCSIGSLQPSVQPGVQDVEIKSDGKGLDQTECPLMFKTAVKYAPDKKRAYAWNMGQEPTFWSNNNDSAFYDLQMLVTFRVD